MGADQFHGEALEGPLSVSLVTVTNTCAVGWPHAFRFEAEGKVERVNWNFGDGVAAEGVNPAEHAFAVPGVYTVGVTVSNATHMAHATFEITVVAYVCHVSPCGGHTAPFDTWEKAATNIQEAVDAVAPARRARAGHERSLRNQRACGCKPGPSQTVLLWIKRCASKASTGRKERSSAAGGTANPRAVGRVGHSRRVCGRRGGAVRVHGAGRRDGGDCVR